MGLTNFIGNVATGGALNAGREQRKGINKAMGNINESYGTAKTGLAGGYGQAQGQLDQGFDAAKSGLSGGMQSARGALQPLAEKSAGAYTGLVDQYNSGSFDPTNFNFQESPGYQFALNEGMKPYKEMAAGSGRTGAEDKALAQYATGAANQEYGAAFNRNLAAENQNFNQGATLASPAFGAATGIANTYAQEGQGLASLGANQGQQSAGLSSGLAGLLAGLNTEQGTSLANLNLGKGAVNGQIQTAGYAPLTNLASQGLGGVLGSQSAGKLGGALDAKGLSSLAAMGI